MERVSAALPHIAAGSRAPRAGLAGQHRAGLRGMPDRCPYRHIAPAGQSRLIDSGGNPGGYTVGMRR